MFNEFITWIMSIFHKAKNQPHTWKLFGVYVSDAVSYSTMDVVLKVYFDSIKK